MSPLNNDHLLKLFGAQPQHPDVRVTKCLEAFKSALEQYDCDMQIALVFQGDRWQSSITIVPRQPPEDIGNSNKDRH